MDFDEFVMLVNKLATGFSAAALYLFVSIMMFLGNKYIPAKIDPEVLREEFGRLDNKGILLCSCFAK
jgi:hypothetical protein